jgi:methylenetetrahydrofolate reductase (NADPH)
MPAPTVSFEFFPPQSLEGSFRLWDTVRALQPLQPTLVSVTYGAGGTTRKLTHEAVTTIQKNYGLRVAAHLTCVDATRAETMEIADQYAAAGVSDIVALRGDPPKGAAGFVPHPEGFTSAVDLIGALADTGKFTLRVGAYPDRHPEAADDMADIHWLKAKLEAGASEAITQFFFEADTFLRFRDKCAAAGITAPIIPGILPIENWAGTKRFAQRCGTPVPAALDTAFTDAARDGREAAMALTHCTDMCSTLISEGVGHFHFYTLNKPELTRDVCAAIGVTPRTGLQDVA